MEQYDNALRMDEVLNGASYKYHIEKVLGQGSFGITYLASVKMAGALGAIDTNIKVAIKEFFMHGINGRSGATVTSGSQSGLYDYYKKKFKREAINLSKLQHTNIIKVIESFEANNTIYYVMEYIDGGSLDDYIAKKNIIKEDEAIKIVRQIGSALTFMHMNKMLHLDLKPANIMMKKSGDIVLIDFGLSKQYNSKGEPESSTKVGAGTPGYAPIEQANYREGKGFPETMDVYALGGTMFKMLTGVRPPDASDILNDGFPYYELKEQNISDRTSSSVAKAMAPIKKDRYQTVEEFLEFFEEEPTIIDVETHNKPKERKNQETNKKPFNILPSTKKVEIVYTPSVIPLSPSMYCAIIKKDEVQIICGARKSSWTFSRKSFSKFLVSLNSLNLNIRDHVNPERLEGSEEAAKLSMTLYDDDNSVYAKYWIGGWNNQFGNIIGETQIINEKVKNIIPHLVDFLKLPTEIENKKGIERGVKTDMVKRNLQISPDTSKVRIEYWPKSELSHPRYDGAFIASVTPYEVNPNVTQETTREMISMTQGSYKNFLKALQALKLEILEEVVEQSKPSSFSPAKLKISLYDKSGVAYSDLWIDGMNNGNIVGNVDEIEKQIIRIVPGLINYLNGSFYEIPDPKKEIESQWKYPKSKSTYDDLNKDNGNISYRWWAIIVLILEICFAGLMLTLSRESHLDSDGKLLSVLYFFASLFCVFFLFSARKKISFSKWRMISIFFTTACFANSCLIPIWNGSLTGAYFILSLGLSLISSFTLLIKKSV